MPKPDWPTVSGTPPTLEKLSSPARLPAPKKALPIEIGEAKSFCSVVYSVYERLGAERVAKWSLKPLSVPSRSKVMIELELRMSDAPVDAIPVRPRPLNWLLKSLLPGMAVVELKLIWTVAL